MKTDATGGQYKLPLDKFPQDKCFFFFFFFFLKTNALKVSPHLSILDFKKEKRYHLSIDVSGCFVNPVNSSFKACFQSHSPPLEGFPDTPRQLKTVLKIVCT